jgi:hypothetical protein
MELNVTEQTKWVDGMTRKYIFVLVSSFLFIFQAYGYFSEGSFLSSGESQEESHISGFQVEMDRLQKEDHGHIKLALLLRAEGVFGKELSKFWMLVKNTGVGHDAIWDYPAHCRLTASFPCILLDEQYIAALKEALDGLGHASRNIGIVGLHQTDNFDYIQLDSPFLLALTTDFVNRIGVSEEHVKGIDFPFHITLHKHNGQNDAHLGKIRHLEREIELDVKVNWVLYLYRSIDDELEVVKKIYL